MPRTTTVHLLTGDYADRLETIGAAAQAALKDETPLAMAERHPYEVLKAEFDELKAEALEKATTVHLASLPRTVWRELKRKHPPRSAEDYTDEIARGDRLAGVNTEAVEDDLVYESVKAWQAETGETVDYGASRAAFDEWADRRSEGEWQSLVTRAWELTNGVRLDPKELPPLPTKNDS